MKILKAAKRAIERSCLRGKKSPEDKFQWKEPLKNYGTYHRLVHDCEYPNGDRPLRLWEGRAGVDDIMFHTIDLRHELFAFDEAPDTLVKLFVGTCPKCKLTIIAEVQE